MVSLMRAGTISRHAKTVFLRILHSCAWLSVRPFVIATDGTAVFMGPGGAFSPGLRSARPGACARARDERLQEEPVSERDVRQEPDAAAQGQGGVDGHTPRRLAAAPDEHTRSYPANLREP